ncbi:DNA-binding protein [Phormidium tenue FACHB-886]|nr:DNA-binding protein [Phormidium tenue FACHB-886]
MDAIALRLKPQQDLRVELEAFVQKQSIEAGYVITCVGSLTKAVLRLADQSAATQYEGKFEIVSLTGILSTQGSHCHIAIADPTGKTIGGHLMNGSLIYTTAEIVIGVLPNLSFKRELDPATGYRELTIYATTKEN